MKKIASIGSGNLCERMIYYFQETGYGNVVGMFDDFEASNSYLYDRPILGSIKDIKDQFDKKTFDSIIITVGYNQRKFRKEMYEFVKRVQVPLETFVHPSSYVERNAVIKEGTIILTNCTIDTKSVVGENVVLSSRCFVSHDVQVGPHSYFAPAVKLAGNSQVGESCFLGINTTVIDNIKISSNVQSGGGSVIIRDVPPDVMVAGVPAVIKKHLDHI